MSDFSNSDVGFNNSDVGFNNSDAFSSAEASNARRLGRGKKFEAREECWEGERTLPLFSFTGVY